MTLGTPLSNVALHFPSSYLSCVLATVLLGVTLRGAHSSDPEGELPPPPLPSQGGSLDAWANSAAGLAVDFCIDREADSAAYAICKQNVMTDSSICSSQRRSSNPRDSLLRYEACMDASLFTSGCAQKTRERFWKEALKEAVAKAPTAWQDGWTCKDKNRTEDAIFGSFWDALCQRNASAACFPTLIQTPQGSAALIRSSTKTVANSKASSNVLHVSKHRYGASYKKEVYRQWLRNRLPQAVGMPTNCKSLLHKASTRGGRKLEMQHTLESDIEVPEDSGEDSGCVVN